MAADTISRDDLIDVVDEYYKDLKRHGGFLLNFFNVGISCRKLLALHDEIRNPESTSPPPEPRKGRL